MDCICWYKTLKFNFKSKPLIHLILFRIVYKVSSHSHTDIKWAHYLLNQLSGLAFFLTDSHKPYCSWKPSSTGWVYAGSVYQYSLAWKKGETLKGILWLHEKSKQLQRKEEMSKEFTHCFLSSSFSSASRRRPRPSWPKLLTQLQRKQRQKKIVPNVHSILLLSWFIVSHADLQNKTVSYWPLRKSIIQTNINTHLDKLTAVVVFNS